MSVSSQLLYQDGNVTLNGYLAMPANISNKTPAVIVAHDWTGRNEFACQKADELAAMGYIGFALDMYGDGKLGATKEDKMALIAPLMQNRKMLQQRIIAAFNTVKSLTDVDANKIAAIGFCFGGLCVLDLARSGQAAAGVVSFHGLLNPTEFSNQPITAKVLALHGYNDPMATPENVVAFGNEMTTAKADWQLNMYGNTLHAFMNESANDPGFGTVYQPQTAKRAWLAMKNFLTEIFS